MLKVSTLKARATFAELINRAAFGKERVILTRHGKPVAAMVSLDDLESLEQLEDQRDAQLGAAALEQWKAEGAPTVPWATLKAENGL